MIAVTAVPNTLAWVPKSVEARTKLAIISLHKAIAAAAPIELELELLWWCECDLNSAFLKPYWNVFNWSMICTDMCKLIYQLL